MTHKEATVASTKKPGRRDALADFFRPQEPAGVADLADAKTIALDLLEPNPFQPRTFHGDDAEEQAALQELANDMKAHGVLQPLLVRAHPQTPGRYQIVAGERRWRAARDAGLENVPVDPDTSQVTCVGRNTLAGRKRKTTVLT